MGNYYFLAHTQIDAMLGYLASEGYNCLAPRHHNGSINYEEISKAEQLPWGYEDEQRPGYYRVIKGEQKRAFAHTVAVASVKPLLFKPRETVWKVVRDDNGKLAFNPVIEVSKIAVFGIRPCDLRGIEIQDRVFMENSYNDVRYTKRRQNQFLIAMNCTKAHYNCFCTALGDTPRADRAYDLAMTEIDGGFVVEIGSEPGRELLNVLALSAASGEQVEIALKGIDNAAQMQHKKLPPINELENKLTANPEHPRWEDVTKRCLSCGNCTNACPTCFCHTERDEATVLGNESSHTREWDSCFSVDHSYTHGEIFRENPRYRYRQWLTHKFSTWRDQFRTKGCVGCGRCVTWCPVKIDVVDEINAICK